MQGDSIYQLVSNSPGYPAVTINSVPLHSHRCPDLDSKDHPNQWAVSAIFLVSRAPIHKDSNRLLLIFKIISQQEVLYPTHGISQFRCGWRECPHTREQQKLTFPRCFVAGVMVVRLTSSGIGIWQYNHRMMWGRTFIKWSASRGMGLNGGKGKTMNFFVYMLLHWLNYFI